MVATMTVLKWEKWLVTLFTVCILQSPFSIRGDTWVSTIYCIRIKKLKKHMTQCELSRSLRVSVFTIESVLCLIYLQNTSFMFALHQFSIQPLEDSAAVLQSLALFFTRLGFKVWDSFCGYSIKENKGFIWLMMNYSVLFIHSVIIQHSVCYSYTVNYFDLCE